MPRFKVGDQVERIGAMVSPYPQVGVITRVIPNKHGIDQFTEYEVNFQNEHTVILFEMQLRLVSAAEDIQ